MVNKPFSCLCIFQSSQRDPMLGWQSQECCQPGGIQCMLLMVHSKLLCTISSIHPSNTTDSISALQLSTPCWQSLPHSVYILLLCTALLSCKSQGCQSCSSQVWSCSVQYPALPSAALSMQLLVLLPCRSSSCRSCSSQAYSCSCQIIAGILQLCNAMQCTVLLSCRSPSCRSCSSQG
jgi:hypothetical protein